MHTKIHTCITHAVDVDSLNPRSLPPADQHTAGNSTAALHNYNTLHQKIRPSITDSHTPRQVKLSTTQSPSAPGPSNHATASPETHRIQTRRRFSAAAVTRMRTKPPCNALRQMHPTMARQPRRMQGGHAHASRASQAVTHQLPRHSRSVTKRRRHIYTLLQAPEHSNTAPAPRCTGPGSSRAGHALTRQATPPAMKKPPLH